jgi:hypothetical protein
VAELRVQWQPDLPVNDDTMEWLCSRLDEVKLLERFTVLMATELASNRDKGDRPGWLMMSPGEAIGEVLYHAAKLSYAARQFGQGDGSIEQVREFAADVANCALMTLDVVEQRELDRLAQEPDRG